MRRGVFAITSSAIGDYDRSERVIQGLLSEAGIGGIGRELVSVDARGAEVAADWKSLKSPENYVGFGALRTLRLLTVRYWTSVASTPSRRD